MTMIRSILLYFCLYYHDLVFGNPIDTNLTLELVQVMFRHGARTPLVEEIEVLPEYNESLYQPWGLAQLTKEGMIQEYAIGTMLRQRYNGFLSDLYKPEDVYAYASNTERTIASLQLVLAALYTPVDEQIWNNKLNWIPIPVHTVPRPLDILMKQADCPAYIQELEKVYNMDSVKSSQYDSIFRNISDIFGRPVDQKEFFQLYNLLKVNKEMNIPQPQWYTDELLKKMEDAGEFHLDVLSYTDTLKRLYGGTFVKRFLENINKSNSNENKKKIYLYSGHEKTLHAYMRSNNITTFGNPNYGSAIIMEKFRSIQNQYYIKLLYWTGEPKKMHVLKLEKCSEICPLQEYSEIVQSSLPSDDEMLCLLKNRSTKDLYEILSADFGK